MTNNNIVGRIMDKAASANSRALFAALQAALGPITDMAYGRSMTLDEAMSRIEKALDLGAEYGSPEHLVSLEIHQPAAVEFNQNNPAGIDPTQAALNYIANRYGPKSHYWRIAAAGYALVDGDADMRDPPSTAI